MASSFYRKNGIKKKVKHYWYKDLNILKFNTLIIDGEGVEKHYIDNIGRLKNIKHIFFEFHNDIFSK